MRFTVLIFLCLITRIKSFSQINVDYDFKVKAAENNQCPVISYYKDSLGILSVSFKGKNCNDTEQKIKYIYNADKSFDRFEIIKGPKNLEDYFSRTQRDEDYSLSTINEYKKYDLDISSYLNDPIANELYIISYVMSLENLYLKKESQRIEIGGIKRFMLYFGGINISSEVEKLGIGSKFEDEENILVEFIMKTFKRKPIYFQIVLKGRSISCHIKYKNNQPYTVFTNYYKGKRKIDTKSRKYTFITKK